MVDDFTKSIEGLIHRYKNFKELVNKEQSDWLLTYAGPLIQRFQSRRSGWLEDDATLAENFNLFSILKVHWKEVIAHTPFLTHLLNPFGTHSQGLLFYQSFIKRILEPVDVKTFEVTEAKRLFVKDEYGIPPYGQVDIFLHHKQSGKEFAIIIENKVWAKDQKDQIQRYYNYASKALHLKDEQIRILYLKPLEALPSIESISEEEMKRLTGTGVFKTISYKEHIIQWLDTTLEFVKAGNVRSSIKQYLLTLKKL